MKHETQAAGIVIGHEGALYAGPDIAEGARWIEGMGQHVIHAADCTTPNPNLQMLSFEPIPTPKENP